VLTVLLAAGAAFLVRFCLYTALASEQARNR
jgi:hypothetical protein